jgi:Flp pilus assembly protein TadD
VNLREALAGLWAVTPGNVGMNNKESRLLFAMAGLLSAGIVMSCADSKDSMNSSFDMSEYRRMMERQKNEQAALESPETPSQKLTPEEEERIGDDEVQRRNFPMAGLHYTKALNADPDRNTVRLKLGQIMLQQGMFDAATTQFQDLLKRDSKSALAYQGLGQAYLQQNRLREAETVLAKALALDSSSWVSQNLLGLVYDQQQRHSDAIAAYNAALSLRPREPNILNNLGLAYALSGDHETAIRFFEQALAAGSTSPKLHNNLGVAYAHRKRLADALESFKQAMDEPRAYNNLGVTLLGMGDARVAVVCFEKAIELNPQYYEKANENLRHARLVQAQSSNGPESRGPVSCP